MKRIIILSLLLSGFASAMQQTFNRYMRTVLAPQGVERYNTAFAHTHVGDLVYHMLAAEGPVALHPAAVALSEAEARQRESVAWYDVHKIVPGDDNSRYYHEVWREACFCYGLSVGSSDFAECRCINDPFYAVRNCAQIIDGVVYIDPRCRRIPFGAMRFALFYMGARIKHHDEEIKKLLPGQLPLIVSDRYDAFSERRAHAIALRALDCAWCALQVNDAGVLNACLSEPEINKIARPLFALVDPRDQWSGYTEKVLCGYHTRQKIEQISESL